MPQMDQHHLQHLHLHQHNRLLQTQQQQQQQHFQLPQQQQHPYNYYYPPQYQYPQPQHQYQQNGYHPSNYINPQRSYPQPPPMLPHSVHYSEPVGSHWTNPMVGRPPYWGIGEVGSEQYRGHQGNFGYSHLTSGGIAHPAFVGGLNGHVGGGSHGVPSTSSRPESSVADDSGPINKQAGVSFPTSQTGQVLVTPTSQKLESALTLKMEVPSTQNPKFAQKPPVVRCDICNVSCPNLGVFKMHEKGRRHQRNMKRVEMIKDCIGTGAKLQGQQSQTSDTKVRVSPQTQGAHDGKEKKTTKNVPSGAVSNKNSAVTAKQNKNSGLPEVSFGDGNVKCGKKRKKTKNLKQPLEPSKRKVVIPIVCDLCKVKCETQEVFNRHLSGKKHLSRYKRRKDGLVGLQVVYPPNPRTETIFLPQEGRYMPPHVYQNIPVETTSNPQFQRSPTSEGSLGIPGCGSSSGVTPALESNVTTEPEISQEATIEYHLMNVVPHIPLKQDSVLVPDKVGRPPYRGISEVGGEQYREHHRNFGYSHLTSEGIAHPAFAGGLNGYPESSVADDSGPKHLQAGVSFHPTSETVQVPVTLASQKSESALTLKMEVPSIQNPQFTQKPSGVRCDVCNVSCPNLGVLKLHEKGRRHQTDQRKMKRVEKGKNVSEQGPNCWLNRLRHRYKGGSVSSNSGFTGW